jgi:hypothetical protein
MPKVKDWVTKATKSWHLHARALAWCYCRDVSAEVVAMGDATDTFLNELIERAEEFGCESPSPDDRDEVFAWIKPVADFVLQCRQRWPSRDNGGREWCDEAEEALVEYIRPTFAALDAETELLGDCYDNNYWPAALPEDLGLVTDEERKRAVNSGRVSEVEE